MRTMVWNRKIKQMSRKNHFKAGLTLSFVIFLSLSFYSYNPQDPSFNSFGLFLKITNYCGFIGAGLADLFYQLFGLSAWLIILGGLAMAYNFFTHRLRESLLSFLLFFWLFLFSFSSLSALHFPDIYFFNGEVSLGGGFGMLMVSALKPLFHTIGTAVILWTACILFFLFYGQAFLFHNFLFWPKKALILFVLFSRKVPYIAQLFFSKIGGGFKLFINFFKMGLIFCQKKLALLYGKIFPQKKLSAQSDSQPDTSLRDTDSQFVFQEENLLQEGFGLETENSISGESSAKGESLLNEELDFKQKGKSLREEGVNKEEPVSSLWQTAWSELPSIDILPDTPYSSQKMGQKDVEGLSKKLLDKFSQFAIKGEIKAVKTGPALILFEFKPEDHVKVSRIREMESDLSLALSSESVRIIAPIPGRDVVGIEASMPYREMVYLKSLLKEKSFLKNDLPLVLGRRADNVIGIRDLSRIPHLLVAGTTGSGKSMFVISFITSLLFRHSPETLRLLLIDPKQVDLSSFKSAPHLLAPIVTSANEAVRALHWALQEMEKRYRSLVLFKARDHRSFNETIKNLSEKEKNFHRQKQETLSPQNNYYFDTLPLICLVIEEFGDLMADRAVRRSVENAVVRLAQKARASGIHLLLAMQSPRKDVVTGLIKTNIPGRISFKVASGTDSRVILDETGAERLLSHGDMLFLEPGSLKATRYHGPFVREKDVAEVVNYWQSQGEAFYEKELISEAGKKNLMEKQEVGNLDMKEDPMYDEILEFVKTCPVVSASFLQRKFRIGYPRAARMIEILFEEGQIGPPQGSKPREVLINKCTDPV